MTSTQSQTSHKRATISENEEWTPIGVDKGWAWFVCLSAHISQMLTFGFFSSLGVLYIEWKAYFESSATASSWLISMPYAVACPSSFIIGGLAPRLGVRRMAITGSLISALGTIVGSFATSLWHLYATTGLSGLGMGMLLPSTFIMLTRYFKKRFALASMLAILGVNVAQTIFPPLIRLLITQYNWKGAMFICGAIQMNLVAASGLLRPQKSETGHRPQRNGPDGVQHVEALEEGGGSTLSPENFKKRHSLDRAQKTEGIEGGESPSLPPNESKMAGHHQNKELCIDQAQRTEEIKLDETPNILPKNTSDHLQNELALQTEGTKDSRSGRVLQNKQAKSYERVLEYLAFLEIFSNISFTLLQLALFVYGLAWIINLAHLPSRSKEAGWSDDQGAVLITILAIASIVARLFQGFVVDRGYIGPFRLLLCGQFGAAIVTFLNPASDSYVFLVVYVAVLGAFIGVSTPLLIVCVKAVVSTRHVPAAMSWMVAIPCLAIAVGSVVAGKVFDLTGNYVATFLFAGGMFFASFLFVLAAFILKTRQERVLKPPAPPVQLCDQPGNTTEQRVQ